MRTHGVVAAGAGRYAVEKDGGRPSLNEYSWRIQIKIVCCWDRHPLLNALGSEIMWISTSDRIQVG